jgi:hypothetical protein
LIKRTQINGLNDLSIVAKYSMAKVKSENPSKDIDIIS